MENKLSGNTILITGGASGIGFAYAARFVKAGNSVIICGRRDELLEWAKKQVPELITVKCDVSSETERIALFEKITKEYPKLNVLVNNAGIQQYNPPLYEKGQDWRKFKLEIATNYEAPVHLCLLFIPHLLKQKDSFIINVTSGLGLAAISSVSGYCATKAALHSFTMSLRHQLKRTNIKVIESIPPAVQTDLGGPGHHDFGVPLDDFADHTFACLAKGEVEFGYDSSERRRLAAQELTNVFNKINQ